MNPSNTTSKVREIEIRIAMAVVRDGAALIRVLLQLGDGRVLDLVPTPEDEASEHLRLWTRRAS